MNKSSGNKKQTVQTWMRQQQKKKRKKLKWIEYIQSVSAPDRLFVCSHRCEHCRDTFYDHLRLGISVCVYKWNICDVHDLRTKNVNTRMCAKKKPSKRHVMCWIMEPYWILSAQCIKFIKWIKTSYVLQCGHYSYYGYDYYCYYCRCSLRKHMWTQGRCCFGLLFYRLIVSFSRLASICKIDRNTQIKYRIDVLCVRRERHKYESQCSHWSHCKIHTHCERMHVHYCNANIALSQL